MATKKESKLLTLWKQTPEDKEEKLLQLELSAAEISAKGDLLITQQDVHKQEEEVIRLKQKVETLLSKVGKNWSPADIVNSEIALEEAEATLKDLKNNEKRIRDLMKEYL